MMSSAWWRAGLGVLMLAACGDSGEENGPGLLLLAGDIGGPGNTDGVGSAARFNAPGGMAIDGAGNLYVADAFNYAIRVITPPGVVTTLAGGTQGNADGAGPAAQFTAPDG